MRSYNHQRAGIYDTLQDDSENGYSCSIHTHTATHLPTSLQRDTKTHGSTYIKFNRVHQSRLLGNQLRADPKGSLIS